MSMDLKDGTTTHHESQDRLVDAKDAIAYEHHLTLGEALRLYRKAVLWSLTLSTTIIMEGYDTMLMSNFFAQPAFRERFGYFSPKQRSWQISAPWQAGLNNASTCGQLIGLLLAGYASEKFGFRKTMIAGLVAISGFIFIQFFATSLEMLLVAQVLFGIPLGLFQTTAVVYAKEVSPTALRGYLTVYINICWGIGHLFGAGVLRGSLQLQGHWSYKMPFAIQWFWPLLLGPIILFAPESPWWLVRKGDYDQANEAQQRLISKTTDAQARIDKQTALMILTVRHERLINSQTSYLACFKASDLRRTLAAIGIYVIQTLSGNSLRSSSTYFLEQAGLATTQAFNMTLVSYTLALIGGFVSWAMLHYTGRRGIYFWSLVVMFVLMIIIGGLGVAQDHSSGTAFPWIIGSLLIVSSFIYNAATGPLTNTLCAEIPSTLLTSNTVALARWFYTVSTIVAGLLQPYMTNPDAWNWGAKSGFFWAVTCLISAVFAWFFVPETKDRTPAEMDSLYEKKTPAWRSANAKLEDVLEG